MIRAAAQLDKSRPFVVRRNVDETICNRLCDQLRLVPHVQLEPAVFKVSLDRPV
jgi:hypothetical protein